MRAFVWITSCCPWRFHFIEVMWCHKLFLINLSFTAGFIYCYCLALCADHMLPCGCLPSCQSFSIGTQVPPTLTVTCTGWALRTPNSLIFSCCTQQLCSKQELHLVIQKEKMVGGLVKLSGRHEASETLVFQKKMVTLLVYGSNFSPRHRLLSVPALAAQHSLSLLYLLHANGQLWILQWKPSSLICK